MGRRRKRRGPAGRPASDQAFRTGSAHIFLEVIVSEIPESAETGRSRLEKRVRLHKAVNRPFMEVRTSDVEKLLAGPGDLDGTSRPPWPS